MIMRRLLAAWVIVLTFAVSCLAAGAENGERIAVLVSSSEPPFEETLKGFRGYLEKQGINVTYDVYRLSGDASHNEQIIQTAKKSGARLIFTLGSVGMDAAAKKIPDIPIVACLVLRPDAIKGAPNATGVGLEFPLETQLTWIRTMLPDARTIGVLYNPDENKKRIEAARHIAQGMGLRLEAQEVRSLQDVPAALNALSNSADVLWGLADNLALSSQIAKYILLFSFRNSIPFVGPSNVWVKAGALYSLDWDYTDMGAQCGDMAIKVLRGMPPGDIPPATPRKVLYSVNLKTAQQIKITISEQLAKKALNIY